MAIVDAVAILANVLLVIVVVKKDIVVQLLPFVTLRMDVNLNMVFANNYNLP
jgi:hypothetical protein